MAYVYDPKKIDTGPAVLDIERTLSGTVSVTAGSSKDFTGVGTKFLTELSVGQTVFHPGGQWNTVATITSDTVATVTINWLTASTAGKFSGYYSLGLTQGGLVIDTDTTTYEVDTDQLGVVAEVIQERKSVVMVNLIEYSLATLRSAFADSLPLVDDGVGGELVVMSKSIGLNTALQAVRMRVVPVIGGSPTTNPKKIINFPSAAPTSETLSIPFKKADTRVIPAKFRAWPDAQGRLWWTGSPSLFT